MLYKTSKIVNAGEAIKLPITEGEDLSLNLPAKRQLRGKPLEGGQLLEGQSSTNQAPEDKTTRLVSLASKLIEICAEQQDLGLLLPNPTPKPNNKQLSKDLDAPYIETLPSNLQEVHSTVKEGSLLAGIKDCNNLPIRPSSLIVLILS